MDTFLGRLSDSGCLSLSRWCVEPCTDVGCGEIGFTSPLLVSAPVPFALLPDSLGSVLHSNMES